MTLDPLVPPFDPVTWAIPVFVITILAEIVLGRLRKAKAKEARSSWFRRCSRLRLSRSCRKEALGDNGWPG